MSGSIPFTQIVLACLLWLASMASFAAESRSQDTQPILSVPRTGIQSAPPATGPLTSPATAPTQTTTAPAQTTLDPGLTNIVQQPVYANWDFGCAQDVFPQNQRIARQLRFAMPIPANNILGVVPEPAVIHMDQDGVQQGELTQCSTFAPGHLCYDWHEGTDFSLGGAFLQMGSVAATAAAKGVVLQADDAHFDGCQLNLDPQALTDSDSDNNVICPDPDHPESVALTDANRVQICHPDGTVTQYLHLMRDSIPADIAVNGAVACGQKVGMVGSSGKSSAPHLHFDVLVPISRVGGSAARTRTIGGRSYAYVNPFSAATNTSLWTQQQWNYGASLGGVGLLPTFAHPNGDPTTLACPHLVPPHSGHPGPATPCLHPAHPNGDPVMMPCTHPAHPPHATGPCTHPAHPAGHPVIIAGKPQYTACTHPLHANGHPTTLACTHTPLVPQHPGGHPGPTMPCSHIVLVQSALTNGFSLPGPQCDI